MKFPNYLKNAFAGLGIVSLIFYTCAAADEIASDNNDNNDNNNPPTMTGGVYQLELIPNATSNGHQIYVINTETGVLKKFVWNSNNSPEFWTEYEAFETTFTH